GCAEIEGTLGVTCGGWIVRNDDTEELDPAGIVATRLGHPLRVCPADARIGPREAAGDRCIDTCGVHAGDQIFGRRKQIVRTFVERAEPGVALAILLTVGD